MPRLFATIVSLTLVLVACGGSDSPAATVNGEDILVEDVERLQYDPATELSSEQFGQLLDLYIAYTAFRQNARDQFGVEPNEEEIQLRIGEILSGSGVPERESYLEAQGISLLGMELTVTQMLLEEGLEVALAGQASEVSLEEADAALVGQPGNFTEVCLVHILVDTEEAAQAILEQLEAGADFTQLATELSLDSATAAVGGQLGCAAASDLIPEFAVASMQAPVGDHYGPVESGFGFHVMRVNSRTESSAEEVRDELQTLAVFDTIDAWYAEVLGAADVTVDPNFGVWQSGSTARLVPPGG